MTKEDKELLLKDLCARLPYGIKVHFDCCEPHISEVDEICNIIRTKEINGHEYYSQGVVIAEINSIDPFLPLDEIKPYLRPMSSMTEEEHMELKAVYDNGPNGLFDEYSHIDWLNAHHFDYRGLIEKGLALEAPEGMYNIKEQ